MQQAQTQKQNICKEQSKEHDKQPKDINKPTKQTKYEQQQQGR